MGRRIAEVVGIIILLALFALIVVTGDKYLVRIVGAILVIHLLRELVSATGLIPTDSWVGSLFVNHAQRAAVVETLRALGVDYARVGQKLRTVSQDALSSDQLIALLTRRIAKFPQEISYGKLSVVSSLYYLNTMEASHDDDDLNLMVQLLNRLVLYHRDHRLPDFVLTPKAGNPLLGYAYQRLHGVPLILRKALSERSRAKLFTESEMIPFVNFEGSQRLNVFARDRQEPLRGIAIDCNTSGGTEILESIQEFNSAIERYRWNVERVTEAFVLFRPDNRVGIDQKFAEKGLQIRRYFDLNEDLKKALFDVGPIDDPYAKEKRTWMLKFRLRLEEAGGLVVNL